MRTLDAIRSAAARDLLPRAGLFALVALAGCSGAPTDDSTASDDDALSAGCPDGTEASSEVGGACATVDPNIPSATIDPTLPNLDDLRSGKIVPSASPSSSVTCTNLGNQAGTFYDFAALPMGTETDLQAKMIVSPGGIDNSTHCDIFTTATNRTQHGVEVVGIYAGAGSTPQLGVFDWSCSKTSPCKSNGQTDTGPSWVLSRDFDSCHTHAQSDGHGHNVDIEYYSNKTQRIAAGNPPEWRNTVLLWNYCKKSWDTIYTHTYRATQGDGGGWAPVVEPHIQGPLPKIKEVGFLSASLLHDGKWTTLGPTVTTFRTPAQAGMGGWGLMFRVPNSQWGIEGN